MVGGYSLILRGKFRGSEIVIKKIFDPVITEELMEEFSNEVDMLATIRHPFVVLMMGYCLVPTNLVIIFEHCSRGSLYDVLHKGGEPLSKTIKSKITLQIATAFTFLHKSEVVHRDLKSHNVLLDDNYGVKICDFGIARYFVGFFFG